MKEFKEIFDFIKLNYLYKRYFGRYSLKRLIKFWVSYNYLNMKDKKITKLPDNIGILKNLISLSVPFNELTELPDSFENLQSLRKLNISNNNFTKFPKVLFKLKKLEYLHLDGNNILEEEILKFSNELPECFVTYDPNQGSKKKEYY